MTQTPRVAIRLPLDADFEADRVQRLAGLVNDVYDDAESGMWKRKGIRTNPTKIERFLRAQALILAEIDGELAGALHVDLPSDGVGSFGMLVAARQYRGARVGSALVRRAEQWAHQHACHTMRLELLTPRYWTHPSKEFLKQWYSRIGYAPQTTEPFELMYPELLPELATECDYTVWHKALKPN